MNILNLENWENISKRILSKTRLQEITVFASLNSVETPVITSTSTMKSLVSSFNDTFDNALVKYRKQEVKAKWIFNKLKALGNKLRVISNHFYYLLILFYSFRQIACKEEN